MKFMLFIFLFTTAFLQGMAQEVNQLDSLKQQLDQPHSEEERVDLLNAMGFATINIDLQEAENYTQQALEQALASQYAKGQAFSYSNLGIIAGYRGQKENSFNNYLRSLAISDSIGDLIGMARIHNNLAINYDYLGDKQKALEHALQAKDLYVQAGNHPRLSTAYNTLGTIYEDLGQYEEALSGHLESMRLDKETNNLEGVCASLLNIGNIYSYQRNYDQAEASYLEALQISEQLNHQEYTSIACSSLSKVFKVREDYATALQYQQRSLQIAQQMGKKFQTDMDYNGLGEIYQRLGQHKEALNSFKQALGLSQELGNLEGISIIRTNIGKLLLDQSSYQAAIEQLEGALQSSVTGQELEALMNVHQALGQAYQGLGDFENALKHQLSYEQIKDTLVIEANSERILALQTQYETDKKDQEIALLNTEKGLQEVAIKQQATQRNLLIIAVLSIAVIAFLLVKNYQGRIKTRELLYQKSREFQEMRSRFFTNISHEFRTPLTLIGGPLAQLRSDSMSSQDKVNGQLDMMDRNVKRLQRLTNQILDLSKLEEGQLTVQNNPQDLSKSIRLISGTFQSIAASRNITFQVDLPGGNQALTFSFDGDIFEKILYNLLSNAFKFTGDGGQVNADFSIKAKPGIQILRFKVRDTGPGMTRPQMDRIFDRFYQTEESIKGEFEGTGIGLALCKELLDLVGGEITVESSPKHGSTFEVRYPMKFIASGDNPGEADIPAEIISHQDPEVEASALHNTQILIVEDNYDLRQYIRDCLGDAYQFTEAVHGKEGLAKALELLPDLIISDLMMPEMNGMELCTAIKKHEATAHIPFIMLTAKATQKSKLAGLESGADDYIYKPFDPQEIVLKIRNILNKQEHLREKLRRDIFLDPRPITELSQEEQFLLKFKNLIEEHMQDTDLSVDYLSKEMGLSRVQLFRKLRTLVGLSPTEFIRTQRLRTAEQLMNQRWGTVSDIAYRVGFNNLSYFSKCFKQEFGKTPSEYLELS